MAVRLHQVSIRGLSHGQVEWTFRWGGDIGRHSSVLWTDTLRSADGERVVQVGYKLVDGHFSSQYVFDFLDNTQENLDDQGRLDGQTLVFIVPGYALKDTDPALGRHPRLTVDGEAVGDHIISDV